MKVLSTCGYHLGPQWAKRLMFTGDCLLGSDAARVGLVLDAYPAEELDAQVSELARRIACVDAELLSAHKRAINVGLELMGASTLQRLDAEMDARAICQRSLHCVATYGLVRLVAGS